MEDKSMINWSLLIRRTVVTVSTILIVSVLMFIAAMSGSIGHKLKPLLDLRNNMEREFQDYSVTSFSNIQESRFVTVRYHDKEGNICLFGIVINGQDDSIIVSLTKGHQSSDGSLEEDHYTTCTVDKMIYYQGFKEAYPEFKPGFRYLEDFLLKSRYDRSMNKGE